MTNSLLQDQTPSEGSYDASHRLLAQDWFGWTVEIMNLLRRIKTDTHTCSGHVTHTCFFTRTVSVFTQLFPRLSRGAWRVKVLQH